MYAVMTDEQVNTNALTSIFSFSAALRAENSGQSSAIGALLQREEISGTGEFGTNESNGANDPGFTAVYSEVATNAQVTDLCSTATASGNVDGNKLGNVRFVRFMKSAAGAVTIRADGAASALVPGSAAAVDPDSLVYQRGARISFGTNNNGEQIGESTANGEEVISQVPLAAGTYVLVVYAFEVVDPNNATRVNTPRCLNLTISGT